MIAIFFLYFYWYAHITYVCINTVSIYCNYLHITFILFFADFFFCAVLFNFSRVYCAIHIFFAVWNNFPNDLWMWMRHQLPDFIRYSVPSMKWHGAMAAFAVITTDMSLLRLLWWSTVSVSTFIIKHLQQLPWWWWYWNLWWW